MRFRLLTNEELSVLEKDLIAFLVINGVDGSEWEKINVNEPDKALQLVEIFSDTVLEKVYSKIEYVEFRSEKNCIIFFVKDSETELISLQLNENSEANLLTVESIHETLKNHSKDIQLFTTTKKHHKTREEEVHLLIEQGCVPSAKEFWVSLMKILEK